MKKISQATYRWRQKDIVICLVSSLFVAGVFLTMIVRGASEATVLNGSGFFFGTLGVFGLQLEGSSRLWSRQKFRIFLVLALCIHITICIGLVMHLHIVRVRDWSNLWVFEVVAMTLVRQRMFGD